MKLKALLLGLAIAASQTGYSMDGIQEPENAACKLVKKFVTITQANDSIEAITNALAEILKQKAKGPLKSRRELGRWIIRRASELRRIAAAPRVT